MHNLHRFLLFLQSQLLTLADKPDGYSPLMTISLLQSFDFDLFNNKNEDKLIENCQMGIFKINQINQGRAEDFCLPGAVTFCSARSAQNYSYRPR